MWIDPKFRKKKTKEKKFKGSLQRQIKFTKRGQRIIPSRSMNLPLKRRQDLSLTGV